MKRSCLVAILSAIFTFSNQAAGQTPTPCESEAYRAFDFWLGEWRVETPDGKLAGKNKITRQENGCMILEQWRSAGGSTGQSYNFYDPSAENWRQVWVSAYANIDYVGGLDDNGDMVLQGEIIHRDGRSAPFRGRWRLNEDATVTQSFEEYSEDEKAWKPWFTGIYQKKK